jgi:transcriptional regulator with XRE-family HTH domain
MAQELATSPPPPEHPLTTYLRLTGRSQSWLADELGCTRAWISQIINGQVIPNEQFLNRIADRTGVSVAVLRSATPKRGEAA